MVNYIVSNVPIIFKFRPKSHRFCGSWRAFKGYKGNVKRPGFMIALKQYCRKLLEILKWICQNLMKSPSFCLSINTLPHTKVTLIFSRNDNTSRAYTRLIKGPLHSKNIRFRFDPERIRHDPESGSAGHQTNPVQNDPEIRIKSNDPIPDQKLMIKIIRFRFNPAFTVGEAYL